jgi:hypothetical protein
MDDQYNQQLQEAIRRRLLEEVEGKRGGAASVVNNVYGSAGGGGQGGGLMDSWGGGGGEERDYFVDILREDLDEINEATGKPKGWRKKVHRFTTPRGSDPEKKN